MSHHLVYKKDNQKVKLSRSKNTYKYMQLQTTTDKIKATESK